MKKLLLVPALCLMLFSCGSPTPESYVSIDQTQEDSNPADWEITLNVKEAILLNGALKGSNRFVSVSTTDGVVTLTGNVSSEDQMNRIVRTVENVDGVVSVDNQLNVTGN